MAAVEWLCHAIQINPKRFSKNENLILEMGLLHHLIGGILENFNIKKEEEMKTYRFVRCIIEDLMTSGSYDLSGIAIYTNTPEDVVFEIISGKNLFPSFYFIRQLIELHRTAYPDVYRKILLKAVNNEVLEKNNQHYEHENEE